MLVEKRKLVEVIVKAKNVKAKRNSIVLLSVKSPKKSRGIARTARNESPKKRIKRGVTSDKDRIIG